jgi:hypothetical protein
MKKLLLSMLTVLTLASCGQSEEEKALTRAVYQEYRSRQVSSDTSVPFNILNLSVKGRKASGDTITYEVAFDIQEKHPSRRYYYKGTAEVTKVVGRDYDVRHLHYSENSKLNRN